MLRLHATFRHDLKIKTSDEGRVMKTAAAFTKGMLELEGSLTPILVSLVRKEKESLHMLDPTGARHQPVHQSLKLCISAIFLWLSLSYLSIQLSIDLSIIFQFIYLPINVFIHPHIHPSIYQCVFPSIHASISPTFNFVFFSFCTWWCAPSIIMESFLPIPSPQRMPRMRPRQ